MSDKKEIVIKDACILFDLVDLNLLSDFFQLELIAFTTPQIIAEIRRETQWIEIAKFIENGKLIIDSNGLNESIAEIFNKYNGLSYEDSSVLELALRKQAIVYTSDGRLRKISERNNLKVRGILWIIDELCAMNIISNQEAIDQLQKYSEINKRIPINDVNKLLLKLSPQYGI